MRHELAKQIDRTFLILGTIFSIYLIVTIIELFQQASEHYTTFTLGIFILTGLVTVRDILASESKGFKFWFRLSLFGLASIVSIIAGIYLRYHAIRLETIQPFITNQDIIMGWFMLGSLLLLTWLHWGSILTSIIALSIAYFFLGHLLASPIIRHDEFSTFFSMSYMGMSTTGGIFWFVPLAADKIYFLIIFAALLLGVGMLPLVMEAGKWVGKYVRGGAAFPAVFGSAAMGTVMGQAVSNTMLTGQLTIPMMKKNGFSANVAGAIEAVASTSGQFLPPILGLAAFIIAAYLNIPYIEVALAATLPSLLKVGCMVIAVLVAARAFNLGVLDADIDRSLIFRLFPAFFVSFVVLFVLLLLYYSPNIAALCGIAGMLSVCFLFQGKKYRPTFKTLTDNFKEGLTICTVLCLLLIAIGPLAQMATTTNIAGKLGVILARLVPHNLPLVLVGTMFVAMVLGLGLPTPVAYLIGALTLSPFLQELGLSALAAHLFIFYFAVFSTISPPVAISCLAAAKISKGSFLGTTVESLRIALPSFFVPFAFVFNADLLMFPKVTALGLIAFFMVLLTEVYLTIALYGYFLRKLNVIERSFFAVSSALMMYYLIVHHASGYSLAMFLGLGSVGILWILITKQRNAAM
jgi:TRAP transporter 4TM/12TM fusion protein